MPDDRRRRGVVRRARRGYEINASNNLVMATSVAYMFLISLAFLCMDVGFRLLERRVLAWR